MSNQVHITTIRNCSGHQANLVCAITCAGDHEVQNTLAAKGTWRYLLQVGTTFYMHRDRCNGDVIVNLFTYLLVRRRRPQPSAPTG